MQLLLANAKNNLAVLGACGLVLAGQAGALCFAAFVSGFCFTKGVMLAARRK